MAVVVLIILLLVIVFCPQIYFSPLKILIFFRIILKLNW